MNCGFMILMASQGTVSSSVQKQFYRIRDLFFGDNEVEQNIAGALDLAGACDHPEARWLVSVCAGQDVSTLEKAKDVFLKHSDARSLFFAWRLGNDFLLSVRRANHRLIDGREDLSLLQRSAELGFAYAQAVWASFVEDDDERFKLASLAAQQGEREGFLELAKYAIEREEDTETGKKNLLIAAELGCTQSMAGAASLLADFDVRRWRYLAVAEELGLDIDFLEDFPEQVEMFNSGGGSAAVMYAIGRELKARTDLDAKTIFGRQDCIDVLLPARQAIAFYDSQIVACRDAIFAWTQVGIRCKIVKDIRKMIAKKIWDGREEAEYMLKSALPNK